MTYQENYEQLVSRFGTQQQLADALGCKQPSVWKWLQGKSFMSADLAIKAQKLTNGEIKAVDLCPKLAELETA